jgi:hypothetical protein
MKCPLWGGKADMAYCSANGPLMTQSGHRARLDVLRPHHDREPHRAAVLSVAVLADAGAIDGAALTSG